MFNLESIIRPSVAKLQAYSSARDEYSGSDGVFLDANENPFGKLNRYPDPNQTELKSLLALKSKVSPTNIFIGNGSDELIDLAFRIFCIPGKDKALTFAPTYGMYTVSAALNDVTLIENELNSKFQIDVEKAVETISNERPKLIFICSPNNPSGNLLNREDIRTILEITRGVVIIDEAYIDFNDADSWVSMIADYPNLIVSQTMSKARGLAAARIGIGYSSEAIITLFNKVKPPYNVSQLNQEAAIKALNNEEQYQSELALISAGKDQLINAFSDIKAITKVYPSDSNFLLIEINNADRVYETLIIKSIITRNRSSVIPNTLRISVGTQEENEKLITALKEL